MSSWQDKPQVGQSIHVYDSDTDKGKNGIITSIAYPDRDVYCDFYEKGTEVLDWDTVIGCWNNRASQWQVVR